MTVYEKNNRWYYKFQMDGVQYHRAIKGATDKKSAIKVEIKVKSELMSGRYDILNNKKNHTFFEICDKFEEYAKNNRKNYEKSDKYIVNDLKNFFGNCYLKDFNPFKIEQYRSQKKKDGKKPATINKEVGVLRRIFSIAVDNDWIMVNPAIKSHLKPLYVENKEKRILTIAEENKLLNACTDDSAYLKPIIICALHTGMRKSEILTLEWQNIDIENDIITILTQKNGKKSYIPISNTLKKEFLKLYQKKTSEYVFINPRTNLPYKDIHRSYNTVLKRADIEDFTFHSLRHTACTRLIESGVPLDVVKEIMRHSDIAITLEVYNHINQDRKINAIKILENYGK